MLINKRLLIGVLPLLIFAVIAYFLWRGLSIDPHKLPSMLINQPLPVFNLPSLNHSQRLQNKAFRNEVSLLNIWASWCLTCRDEHMILMKIAREKQLPVFGINLKDDPQQALQWLAKFGDPYRNTGRDQLGQTAIDLGVYGTPETFVIDQQGIIRYKFVGPLTAVAWRQQIEPLIDRLQKGEGR